MPSITVPLTSPIGSPFEGKPPIKSITLKEPIGRLYIALGEPRLLARNADGTMFWFEDKAAIAGYFKACVETEGGAAILDLLTIRDVRAMKEGLFSFFSETLAVESKEPADGISTALTSDS